MATAASGSTPLASATSAAIAAGAAAAAAAGTAPSTLAMPGHLVRGVTPSHAASVTHATGIGALASSPPTTPSTTLHGSPTAFGTHTPGTLPTSVTVTPIPSSVVTLSSVSTTPNARLDKNLKELGDKVNSRYEFWKDVGKRVLIVLGIVAVVAMFCMPIIGPLAGMSTGALMACTMGGLAGGMIAPFALIHGAPKVKDGFDERNDALAMLKGLRDPVSRSNYLKRVNTFLNELHIKYTGKGDKDDALADAATMPTTDTTPSFYKFFTEKWAEHRKEIANLSKRLAEAEEKARKTGAAADKKEAVLLREDIKACKTRFAQDAIDIIGGLGFKYCPPPDDTTNTQQTSSNNATVTLAPAGSVGSGSGPRRRRTPFRPPPPPPPSP